MVESETRLVHALAPYAYAESAAAQMLADGIRRYTAVNRGGVRELARVLGINQGTVLSHMANGRMPIPMDRAPQLARALEIGIEQFCLAVLWQRSPEMAGIIQSYADRPSVVPADVLKLYEDESIGTKEARRVIEEVVRDRNPAERWINLAELRFMRELRKLRPAGLSDLDSDLLLALAELEDGGSPAS